jgi:pyridoxamine 5'-phosphate oxidase
MIIPSATPGPERQEREAMDLGDMRRDYRRPPLEEADLASDWLTQFKRWFEEAEAAGLREPNAMVFATASAAGQPSSRTVLLKDVDERGFALYTNLRSRKGREAAENPRVSLVFPWHPMERQVVAVGAVERVSDEEADEYFARRPHGSQVGAHVSPQSEAIESRAALDRRKAELEERFPEGAEVPRPAHWGGLRVVPETVEFWQGGHDRLHDRLRYRRTGDGWIVERLAP